MYIVYNKNYYLIKNKFNIRAQRARNPDFTRENLKFFFKFLNLHIPFSKIKIINNLDNWYTIWIRYNSCKHTIFSGLNIDFCWTIGYYSIWC